MSSKNLHTSRRQIAVALAVAAGAATGCATVVAAPGHGSAATTSISATAAPARVLHVGHTSGSFVRRIRALEARGYVEIACKVDGALMFNPRTHRSETVKA
jgi:hypothetical protein